MKLINQLKDYYEKYQLSITILLYLLIFLVINIFIFKKGNIVYWDMSYVYNPSVYFDRATSIISNFRFPWYIDSPIFSHISYVILLFVFSIFSENPIIIQFLLYLFLLFFSAFNSYLLLRYLFKTKINSYLIFILWLFFSLNLLNIYFNYRIFNLALFFYSFLPLLLLFFLKLFNNKYFLINFLLLVLFVSSWLSNIAYLPIFFLTLLIFFFLFIKKNIKNYLTLFLLYILIILILSPFLLPQIITISDWTKELALYWWNYLSYLWNLANANILNILSWYFPVGFNDFSIYYKIFWLLPIFIFLYIIILLWFNNISLNTKKVSLIFLFILTLNIWWYNFINDIYSFLFDEFSYISMYRDLHQKFFPLYSVIFLLFLANLFLILKNNKKLKLLLLIYLIWNILIWIYFLFDYNKNSYFKFGTSETKIINLINSDNDNFSILVLPISNTPLTFAKINNYDYKWFWFLQLSTNKQIIENYYWNNNIKWVYDKILNNFILWNTIELNNYKLKYILIYKNNFKEKFNDFKYKKIITTNDYILLENKDFINIQNINYIKNYNNVYNFKNLLNDTLISKYFYADNWKIYLKNQQWLFTKPLFENTHTKVYDYANSWTISKDEIINYVNQNYSNELKKEGFPKKLSNWKIDYKYYTINSDWSIDVELTLYFKPQSYFYLGLIISWATFILLIWYLGFDIVRNRRKNDKKQ